jgi:hypothetical protein
MKKIYRIEFSDGSSTFNIFTKKEAKQEQKIFIEKRYTPGKIVGVNVSNEEYKKWLIFNKIDIREKYKCKQ